MNSNEPIRQAQRLRNAQKTQKQEDSRYHGFSLQSVCWGYRDIFEKAIEGLFEQGLLGAGKQEVSREFFDLLRKADQSCFDHVLKEFLGAINPRTRWIMKLPGVFADVTNLGRELAESKLYYGISYFKTLGEGGLGDSPAEVRNAISHVFRLRKIDEDLALAFTKGYHKLLKRLTEKEIDLYVNEGLKLFHRNRQHGLGFMEGTTKSSEKIIRSITRECRLADVQQSLTSMLRALVGYEIEVSDLGNLDSDDLIERGSSMVCMYKWVYLPLIVRHFDKMGQNRAWYLLMTVVAAGMLSENSFCRIHGHPQYRTCKDLVGEDILKLNLFQIIEYVRVINRIKKQWPGAMKLIDFGLHTEFAEIPPHTPAEHLIHDSLMSGISLPPPAKALHELSKQSVNVFETASLLTDERILPVARACPGLAHHILRPFSFLPDFLYPGQVSAPPHDKLVADLKNQAKRRKRQKAGTDDRDDTLTPSDEQTGDNVPDQQEGEDKAISAIFVYDEWCHAENDYYTDYCFLYEKACPERPCSSFPFDIDTEVRHVRQVFERLKPDLAKKEKYLPDGDYINTDILVDYLVQRHVEPFPRIAFYEKPLINKRDLAVLVLLDVSGSTGETMGKEKVLDIEKRAALIFGQGLDSLGDKFSICGFSGNGRKNCEYFFYKDFDDRWENRVITRLLGAYPSNSTRIGVALRHSGHRMSTMENKQRLIILITDGKPMDSEYDPHTRYAQYDVRKACEENTRMCINTFAISTEENSRADMEIMFPRQRFVILPDITQLPKILPRLYIRMTM